MMGRIDEIMEQARTGDYETRICRVCQYVFTYFGEVEDQCSFCAGPLKKLTDEDRQKMKESRSAYHRHIKN